MAWITAADHAVLSYIQEFIRNPALTAFFCTFTRMGNGGLLWLALTIGLLFIKRTRKTGFLCSGALLMSLLVNNALLKGLVSRPRPYEAFSDLTALVGRPMGASFPSGHTGAAFAFGWVVFRTMPKGYGIAALFIAVLMGLSRLYVGVHYPTDVLGGLIAGILIGELMVRLGKGVKFGAREKKTDDTEEI